MRRRTFSLIKKELLAILLDPKSRISIILPPIIQLLIFAWAATLDVTNISIGILNRDSGEKAFELTQRFYRSPVFTNITYLKSVEEIAPFLDLQKGLMVLSIDETFSRNMDKNQNTDIQLIFDGRRSNSAQILLGYSSEIINQFNQDVKGKLQSPALVPRNWFNPNVLYVWYNIPCLVATLSMIACLVVTTQTVAREREVGTFDQLLVSPLNSTEILIGKTVPGILIGAIEGMLMGAVGVFVFKVPFAGSFLLFCFALFVFVTAISGIGLFISSLCSTQQQALLGSFTFMMPAILLSGFATPIENMPTWLQPVTYLNPLRYMLIISKGIFLKNMSFLYVFQNIWPMMVIGVCTLVGSGLFFRKRFQ